MSTGFRVALDVETSRTYGRGILRGISKYLLSSRPWSIYIEQHELTGDVNRLLSRWDGDGIITRQLSPEAKSIIESRDISAIDLSNFLPPMGIHRICSADRAIGRLGAQHFIERGFRNFACCEYQGQYWSQQRTKGFVEGIEFSNYECKVYEQPFRVQAQKWNQDQDSLAKWLAALPKPVAVLATNDLLGHHVLDACSRAELLVPEQIAVLGVDDDDLICNLTNPPMSSIILDTERIGFEAAKSLDKLMQREGPVPNEKEMLEIPSLGIAVRQSTDSYAVPDPEVARALRYIREHACEGATVQDVLDHLQVSRSWLERSFREYFGRSPKTEIRNVQIERCKELLRMTDLSLDCIARLAGYKHTEYMGVVFKRETGMTPGSYRDQKDQLDV
ncbi:XylR family transcriptional regulator [Bythopirellula goksoeyrii]|uniref:Xylose operon regulatory protein n=1 Tax=Bythopirellula goksoeyrii TaxID=1400387 RepID=A0A5B9Q920_9BACT|nr:DNA-binding transcriptional regulator [Bythopirellula goksoeyrii]QEG33932.1 Xylose operon regulatory protein [Bythopirellula goksoeyrii]